ESHARALPGWLDALGVAPEQRTTLLEPLLAHPDSDARLAAAIRSAPSLGFDQALDTSGPVAHAAALRLGLPARRDPAAGLVEAAVRATLRRSPHASVRRLASRMTTREDAAPLAWVAMRHALARDRSAVVDSIGDRIAREDPSAFALAARLGLADELLGPLADALRSGSPRSVASAARTLASARDPRAEKMLSVCATHDDARVRANAIESAAARARRWRKSMPIYRPDDAHHRPAATSIRVQITSAAADAHTPERVQELLSSGDANRRSAGLWLTERTASELKPLAGSRWADIAVRVAESARRGESVGERVRATRCARRMLAVTTRDSD
ncbi:MAG: hypothetical protein AAFY46_04570, partial [Planctomycetota bacterium]